MPAADPLTVPVPEGVSADGFVMAIGIFIGLKCNPYRNPSPSTTSTSLATYSKGSVEHVAVVNTSNLIDHEAEKQWDPE